MTFWRVLMLFNASVSGGFATVHPNNKLTINAVEAAPLEAFSAEVIFTLGLMCQ